MKVLSPSFRLSVLICLMLAVPARSADLPDLVAKVRPSVVGIGTVYPPRQPNVKGESAVYLATGFVVGDGLHIVTNAHVTGVKLDTENNQTLAVFSGHGMDANAHPAVEVARDEEHDLVVLAIEGTRLPALELGDSDTVREGQDIAFTGFPLGMALGLYPVTHRGTVSAITPAAPPSARANQLNAAKIKRLRNGFDAFQLDATAYPGNSGSPVFELGSGRVIGVINSVVIKETREAALAQPSGITYAIPARYIKPLLDGVLAAQPR
jgi:S1-C subfamily serine protease